MCTFCLLVGKDQYEINNIQNARCNRMIKAAITEKFGDTPDMTRIAQYDEWLREYNFS